MIESLVAHYKLNDNAASTVVVDEKGTNGTAQANTSTKTAAGKVGRALTFNGTSDYIDTNQTFQSTFRNSFGINLWVKPDDGNPAAVQYMLGTEDVLQSNRFYIRIATTGIITCLYKAGGSATISATGDLASFSNGQQAWHMITVVVTKATVSTAYVRIYFDCLLLKTGATASCSMGNYTSANNLYIGAINGSGIAALPYAGLLDNITIFNKAPTAEEAALLYNSGRGTEDFSMYPELSSNGSMLFSQVGV